MKHESREIAYVLMDRVGRPRHVVEVGACGSEHIQMWPFVFDKKCRIQLVEPNPVGAAEIRAAYAGFPNIEVLEYAVAEDFGRMTLLVPDGTKNPDAPASAYLESLPGSPYLSREAAGRAEKLLSVRVETVPFSHIDDGTIDGLSVDTEGAEWFVLKTMKSRPAVISVEMEGPNGYKNPYCTEIEDWVAANGYVRHSVELAYGYVRTDYIYVKE